jgi:tryptophan synthase alpha chain
MFDAASATKRGLLSVYLTAGYPDLDRSRLAFEAAIEGGADWLEVGIPFSDPVADGPMLQRASAAALRAGTKVGEALAVARAVRARHPDIPLVAMTYANLVQRHGWRGFAGALRDAGLDGLIVPDVPLEEAAPLREALASAGLAHIPLVTPTTDEGRMAAIAKTATGFLYVVSNVGVTGQGDVGKLVASTLARARKAAASVPLVVGFGVSTAADVGRLHRLGAQGVIVGSHVVHALERGEDVARTVAALKGAPRATLGSGAARG